MAQNIRRVGVTRRLFSRVGESTQNAACSDRSTLYFRRGINVFDKKALKRSNQYWINKRRISTSGSYGMLKRIKEEKVGMTFGILFPCAALLPLYIYYEGRSNTQQSKTLSFQDDVRKRFSGNSSRFQCLDKQLGEGSFGVVQLGKDLKTNEYVAIKIVKSDDAEVNHLSPASKDFYDSSFLNEFKALQVVTENGGHENLVGLIDVIKVSNDSNPANDELHIVTELVSGGEVFDRLVMNGAFAESDVAKMAHSLASAADFLHTKCKLSHGDIKPENLMFTSETEDSGIKIIDFGTAHVLTGNSEDSDSYSPGFARGTTAYWSPENFLGPEKFKYGAPSDMFSIGIVLYICLYGAHPFDPNNDLDDDQVATRIMDNNWTFLDDRVKVTPAAKKLISALLEPDLRKRYTAKQMMKDPWVQGEAASKLPIDGSDKRLDKFQKARRKLRNGLLTVLIQQAIQSTSADDLDLSRETKLNRNETASVFVRRAFNFFDSDGKGYITPEDVSSTMSELNVDMDCSEAGDLINASKSGKQGEKNPHSPAKDRLKYEDVDDFLSDIPRRRYKAGDCVFKQGDPSENFYLVLKGVVDVFVNNEEMNEPVMVGTVGPGHFFGEQGVLMDTKRSATITCASDVDLLVLDRSNFESLKNEAIFQGKTKSSLEELILGRTLGRLNTLVSASKSCEKVTFDHEDVIFQQGDCGNSVYVVRKGEVSVLDNNDSVLVKLHRGDMFGETSLMTGKPRNATALCTDKRGCTFNKLKKSSFLKIVSEIEEAKDTIKRRKQESFKRSATKK